MLAGRLNLDFPRSHLSTLTTLISALGEPAGQAGAVVAPTAKGSRFRGAPGALRILSESNVCVCGRPEGSARPRPNRARARRGLASQRRGAGAPPTEHVGGGVRAPYLEDGESAAD